MTTNHATSTLTNPADPRTRARVAHLDTHVPAPLSERIHAAAAALFEIVSTPLRGRPWLYRGVTAPDSATKPDGVTAPNGVTATVGVTADELATITRIAPRYAVEWLRQQGVAGL